MANILIAEDDSAMRHFLTREMERAGHRVSAVADGVDALPLLEEDTFDVLVADIVMPDMDGLELGRRARNMDPDIKVIYITGFPAVAMSARNSVSAGTTVLSKPFHLRQLVAEVNRALGEQEIEDDVPPSA